MTKYSISWLRQAVVFIGLFWLAGCAPSTPIDPYPNQQRIIGMTKSAVLACAGKPRREQQRDDVTLLQYYREAPMLEESSPVGKGSFSTIRHGCWATVSVSDDHVTDVQYRFVPPGFDASNDCEEIFEPCLP